MQCLVEPEGEVADVGASNVLGRDDDDSAAAFGYAELFADDRLGPAGLDSGRVVSGLGVGDDMRDLEDRWHADREGEKPDYRDFPVAADGEAG